MTHGEALLVAYEQVTCALDDLMQNRAVEVAAHLEAARELIGRALTDLRPQTEESEEDGPDDE